MLHRCPFSDEWRLINLLTGEVVLLPAALGYELQVEDESFAIVECIGSDGDPQWCCDMFDRSVYKGGDGRMCFLQQISQRQVPRWLDEEAMDWDLREVRLRTGPLEAFVILTAEVKVVLGGGAGAGWAGLRSFAMARLASCIGCAALCVRRPPALLELRSQPQSHDDAIRTRCCAFEGRTDVRSFGGVHVADGGWHYMFVWATTCFVVMDLVPWSARVAQRLAMYVCRSEWLLACGLACHGRGSCLPHGRLLSYTLCAESRAHRFCACLVSATLVVALHRKICAPLARQSQDVVAGCGSSWRP